MGRRGLDRDVDGDVGKGPRDAGVRSQGRVARSRALTSLRRRIGVRTLRNLRNLRTLSRRWRCIGIARVDPATSRRMTGWPRVAGCVRMPARVCPRECASRAGARESVRAHGVRAHVNARAFAFRRRRAGRLTRRLGTLIGTPTGGWRVKRPALRKPASMQLRCRSRPRRRAAPSARVAHAPRPCPSGA